MGKKPFRDDAGKGGRLRNIWVNIKEIQNAFGVKNATVETLTTNEVQPIGTVEKGIRQLLKQLNDGGLIVITNKTDSPNVTFKKSN